MGAAFRITIWSICFFSATLFGQSYTVSSFAIGTTVEVATSTKNQVIDNVRSSPVLSSQAARPLLSTGKLEPTNLNGNDSNNQVVKSKSTPPPTKVQFINRFNPFDGSSTTINPKLVTLPGGRVQTTEKPTDSPGANPSPTTPLPSPTRKVTTPTLTTTVTTTTTARPEKTSTEATTGVGFQQHFIVSTTTTAPSHSLPAFVLLQKGPQKPFNVFDFYRTLYNPVKTHQFTQKVQPFVARTQSFSFIPEHTTSTIRNVVDTQAPTQAPKPIINTSVISNFPTAIPKSKPIELTVSSPNQLDKNVVPPSTSLGPKLPSRLKIELKDSGHKFINRFVVDEDSIRDNGLFLTKGKLEKEVVAPPVTNIRPILSPKISVHVGESGHRFINRFVLTEQEKQGENVQLNGNSNLANTPFLTRFKVDDTNKKLFQTADALRSELKEDSNKIATNSNSRPLTISPLPTNQASFSGFNLTLPSFDFFKNNRNF